MDENQLKEMFFTVQEHKRFKIRLQEHEQLIDIIQSLIPITGIVENLFCNKFMSESVEMIKHSVLLYEDGFFDCAFYSLRQSVEILNNMLLCADDKERLKNWNSKGWFPFDSKVKEILEKQNAAYNEIKTKIPEFFENTEAYLKQANKYIHKQGFDTFYTCYWGNFETNRDSCTKLFLKLIRQAIGMVLVMNIALDPLSLALSDPDVEMHIPFDAMTEPIPIWMFEEILSKDMLEKIKETEFYKELKEYFLSQEELTEATYLVIHEQFFDVQRLNEIEKQSHLLSMTEKLILHILQNGINASYFYQKNYNEFGYLTSYKAKKFLDSWSSCQFDEYLSNQSKKNISWNDMYISIFPLFDSYLIIQHNEIFSDKDVKIIQANVDSINQQYNQQFV